jgi:hypothetical protein
MRSNQKKILGAVAVAGLVAATGSAFTGTGLSNSAGAAQFVGGTVSQTVSGATLTDISYEFSDGTQTAVDGITLTFAAGGTPRPSPSARAEAQAARSPARRSPRTCPPAPSPVPAERSATPA